MLTVINRREMRQDDFQRTDRGLSLSKPALTRFVKRYDARLSETVSVPAIQGKTSYRRACELQVRQLGRVLTEEQASYQPFHL